MLVLEPQMSWRRNLQPVRWQARVQTSVCFYMAVWRLRAWWLWCNWGKSWCYAAIYTTWIPRSQLCTEIATRQQPEPSPPFSLRPEWFGMLYSQADSKKKSNLMMSIFEPGSEPLPWLGKISHLGPISGNLWLPDGNQVLVHLLGQYLKGKTSLH